MVNPSAHPWNLLRAHRLPHASGVLLVAGLWLLVGCGQPASTPSVTPAVSGPSLTVTVATARPGTVERWATVVGTLEARDEAVVAAEGAGGRILGLGAEVGEQVTAGSELAVIDGATSEVQLAQNRAHAARANAALAQATAQVAEAQAVAADAQRAQQRAESLAQAGTISPEQAETRQTGLATANARVAGALAAVALAEADIARIAAERQELELAQARTRVRAPVDGLVIARPARVGEVAAAGQVLFRLATRGEIEFVAEVSEQVLPALVQDLPVEVDVGAGLVPGTVRRVDPAVDRGTRLGSVRVALGSASSGTVAPVLHPGASARGRIRLAVASGLVVPSTAVLRPDGRPTVVVVDGAGTAHRRPVILGLDDGTQVVVADGLAAGDVVVARAPGFVADGAVVGLAPMPVAPMPVEPVPVKPGPATQDPRPQTPDSRLQTAP